MRIRHLPSSIAAIVLAFTVTSSTHGDILYGVGQQIPEMIYEIDTVAKTITPVCTIDPHLAPNNSNSPNGLAVDVDNQRLYFSINDSDADGVPSSLYFCDLITNTIEFAGILDGQAAGGTFDQLTKSYVYILNATDNLAAVTLDPITGFATSESLVAQDFSGDTVLFRGGDMAIDCSGVLYGSSLGSHGGTKAFFSIDLLDGNAFSLIHEDPSGDNSNTGYATAKQLAFAEDGLTLYAQTEGKYWQVDKANGALSGELDIPEGIPLGMTDLASSVDCVCVSDLIAGGGSANSAEDVGDVLITKNSDGTFDVRLETTGTWKIAKIHVHAACKLEGVPQTRTGNPKIGHFAYQRTYDSMVQVATLNILDPECGGCEIVFAVHAEVVETESYRGETAWGDGPGFEGRSWATYMDCRKCN